MGNSQVVDEDIIIGRKLELFLLRVLQAQSNLYLEDENISSKGRKRAENFIKFIEKEISGLNVSGGLFEDCDNYDGTSNEYFCNKLTFYLNYLNGSLGSSKQLKASLISAVFLFIEWPVWNLKEIDSCIASATERDKEYLRMMQFVERQLIIKYPLPCVKRNALLIANGNAIENISKVKKTITADMQIKAERETLKSVLVAAIDDYIVAHAQSPQDFWGSIFYKIDDREPGLVRAQAYKVYLNENQKNDPDFLLKKLLKDAVFENQIEKYSEGEPGLGTSKDLRIALLEAAGAFILIQKGEHSGFAVAMQALCNSVAQKITSHINHQKQENGIAINVDELRVRFLIEEIYSLQNSKNESERQSTSSVEMSTYKKG